MRLAIAKRRRFPPSRSTIDGTHSKPGQRGRLDIGLGCLSLVAIGLLAGKPRPTILWNVTASAPLGFYSISPTHSVKIGDFVAAWPPAHFRTLAAYRHYLPLGVPLVKRVKAAGRGTLCARGNQVYIDGKLAAKRRTRDSRGRQMPAWQGCETLKQGQLVLLSPDPDSFDARYFGATSAADILGRATLLWPR